MTEENPQTTKVRLSPHDIRNQDLVNKFMAATPPYLYTPPGTPHNFFFSEMLRSLVQNKRNENLRNAQEQLHQQQQQQQQQQQVTRRPRKRTWSQHRSQYDIAKENNKDVDEKPVLERPLELTKQQLFGHLHHSPKREDLKVSVSPDSVNNNNSKMVSPHISPALAISPKPLEKSAFVSADSSTASPTDLILPPPPPVWYPPIYPPYGIDPLHFFIDLRVSGQIFDRKRELAEAEKNEIPNNNSNTDNKNKVTSIEDIMGPTRQGSAFSVPKSSRDTKSHLQSAINLSAETSGVINEKMLLNPEKNTNYVMQNLPRIYGMIDRKCDSKDTSYEEDFKKQSIFNDIHKNLDVCNVDDKKIEYDENETIAVDEDN